MRKITFRQIKIVSAPGEKLTEARVKTEVKRASKFLDAVHMGLSSHKKPKQPKHKDA